MVVVDTTPPQIRVELRESSPGRVQLAWAATDSHVDVAQLRLEYIQPGQPDWQTVGVVPRAIGQTEWSVPQAGMVAVRASIGDHAKNTGRAEAQLRVSAAPEGTRPSAPASRQPVALPSLGSAPDLAQSPLGTPPTGLAVPQDGLALPSEGPAIRERSPVFAQPVSRATDGLQAVEQPAPGLSAVPSLSAVPNLSTVPTSDGGTMSLNPAPGSGSVDMSPSIASGATRPAGEGATWGDQSKKSRLINSRRFHLGYSIQDVGPSGIGAVEIYATDTDGQRWFRYGKTRTVKVRRSSKCRGRDLRIRALRAQRCGVVERTSRQRHAPPHRCPRRSNRADHRNRGCRARSRRDGQSGRCQLPLQRR